MDPDILAGLIATHLGDLSTGRKRRFIEAVADAYEAGTGNLEDKCDCAADGERTCYCPYFDKPAFIARAKGE